MYFNYVNYEYKIGFVFAIKMIEKLKINIKKYLLL